MARLDLDVFPLVRRDKSLTLPAALTAAGAMLAFGVGGYLWVVVNLDSDGDYLWESVVGGSVLGALLWGMGVFIAYFMLRGLSDEPRETIEVDEVLRTSGFACVPLAIGLLMVIPEIAFGVGLIAVAAFFIFQSIAFSEAFDVRLDRAVLVGFVSFAPWALLLTLLASADNTYAPGVFVFDSIGDLFAR